MSGLAAFRRQFAGTLMALWPLICACADDPDEGDPPYNPDAEKRTEREIVEDWCRFEVRCQTIVEFHYYDIPGCVEKRLHFIEGQDLYGATCREAWRENMACASDEHVDNCAEFESYFLQHSGRCAESNQRFGQPEVACDYPDYPDG